MRTGHVLTIGGRVLLQIRRDPRFVALSLIVPIAIVVLLKLVLDAWPALDRIGVDAGANALPAGAFVVHFVTYVLAAIALVRERTSGTLDRMLVATFRRGEIILGYVVGFAAMAAAQAVLVLLTIAVLYDVPRLGARLPLVLTVVFLLAIASIGLGLLVSSTARSEGQIFPFIPAVIVPGGARSLCGRAARRREPDAARARVTPGRRARLPAPWGRPGRPSSGRPERPAQPARSSRRPKPYFATDHVAKKANGTTATTDGMVASFTPALALTMSGPNTAVNSTASQMTAIEIAVHSSRMRNHGCRSAMVLVCGCEIVDMVPPFSWSTSRIPGDGTSVRRTGSAARRYARAGPSSNPSLGRSTSSPGLPEPLLDCRGICKRFGAVEALANVDFEVYPGEVVALVGDNGAGKSTLIKATSGTQPADRGTVPPAPGAQGAAMEERADDRLDALGVTTIEASTSGVGALSGGHCGPSRWPRRRCGPPRS